MVLELKDFELNGKDINRHESYPGTGLYLATDGISTFIASVSSESRMVVVIPVPLDMIKQYEIEHSKEKMKPYFNQLFSDIDEKLNEIIRLSKPKEEGLELQKQPSSSICFSEDGFIGLIKSITESK